MKLVLPYPVSSNRYWRSFVPKGWKRAIVALSDEAKAYKSECAWLAKAAGFKPLAGPVEVRLRLVPKNRRRLDLSNCWKVAEDALQGVAFDDDAQVYRLQAELCDPDGKGRLEVEILPYVMGEGVTTFTVIRLEGELFSSEQIRELVAKINKHHGGRIR